MDRTGEGKNTVPYIPFDSLLKEKKLAEKSGKGHDTFCLAETTTSEFGEDRLLDEMDEDDLDQVAVLALQDRDWLISGPLTPDSNRGDGDDLGLGDAERRKKFGGDGGKSIMGILEHDRIAKREVWDRQAPSLRLLSLPGARTTRLWWWMRHILLPKSLLTFL